MSDKNPGNSKNPLIYLKDLTSEPGATGIAGDYQDRTDPKYVGPGTWDVIHRRSFKARTRKTQLEFIILMKDICDGFPCHVCRGHCKEYIKNHPLEEYLEVMIDINGKRLALGLFVWSWKFHNSVNTRLKKPIMSWETAYNIYSDKENLVCSKNCLEADGAPVDNGQPSPSPKITTTPVTPKITTTDSLPITSRRTEQPFRMISVNRKQTNI